MSPIEKEILKMAIANHFLLTFKKVKYRGIDVAGYLVHHFTDYLRSCNIHEILQATPGIIQDVTKADVFSLVDGDYPCCAKPGKRVLVLGVSVDISRMLPANRVILAARPQPDAVAKEELLKTVAAELESCRNDFIFKSLRFRQWFQECLLQAIVEIDQYMAYFDNAEIGCVVASSYSPLGHTGFWIAKSRGIPSIAYQPEFLLGTHPTYWPELEIPVIATFKTVWGKQHKEYFMSFGVPGERLPIIGNPYFDRIHSYQAISNAEFRQKYDIPDSCKIVLHPTQFNIARRLEPVKVAVEAAKVLPDTVLLLKIRYPVEREVYQDMVADHPRIRIIGEDGSSIYDLIANADVVLTWFSTCGVEAMLFGKPVVVIADHYEEPPYSYTGLGAPEAQNGAELEALLRKLFSDPEYRREVRAKIAERLPDLCLPDGKATSRLAEFVLKIADGKYKL
jgi:glycosyltransferase involved in cell wall biosynthesis